MFEVGLKLDSSRAMFQISMVNDMWWHLCVKVLTNQPLFSFLMPAREQSSANCTTCSFRFAPACKVCVENAIFAAKLDAGRYENRPTGIISDSSGIGQMSQVRDERKWRKRWKLCWWPGSYDVSASRFFPHQGCTKWFPECIWTFQFCTCPFSSCNTFLQKFLKKPFSLFSSRNKAQSFSVL